jgi:hypothetical protein
MWQTHSHSVIRWNEPSSFDVEELFFKRIVVARIPDFILKPIVAQQRDSRWEVLDLESPRARLICGKGSRARLSADVWKAIRQLRHYGEHFQDPAHMSRIAALLGHP